jgi:hypothetical protein
MIRVLLPLLMAAFLITHDVGLPVHGHEEAGGDTHQDTGHPANGGHHTESHAQDDGQDADVIEEPCGVQRLTPAWIFADELPPTSVNGDHLPVAPVLAAFAAVSPSLVNHPPIHAPKTLRALYEVYRI